MIGIGTDILAIKRLQSALECDDGVFREKVFTPAERALVESKSRPLYHYATRFAGKEAIFKALSPQREIRLNEIEILCDTYDAPVVNLYGAMADVALEKGVCRVTVTLSYEDEYAVAFAVAE